MMYIKLICIGITIFMFNIRRRYGLFAMFILYLVVYLLDWCMINHNYVICVGNEEYCQIQCAYNYLYWRTEMKKYFCTSN